MSPATLIHTICYALIGVVYLCLGIHLYDHAFVHAVCSFCLVLLYALLAFSGMLHKESATDRESDH